MTLKGIILCAGLGQRLRPVTERWPKPGVPMLGQPLLRYALSVLKRAGVSAVGINTHHLPEVMRSVAEAECARAKVPLAVSHEPVIQGTGGGIRGLKHLVGGDPFVVFNGDVLFSVDLSPVIEAHLQSGAAATMVLLGMPEGEKYASVDVDGSFRVRRIAGHGPGGSALTSWHFSGVHVMSPSVFDFMRPEGAEDINREVYVRMMERGLVVRGHLVRGAYWSDVGTPARYASTIRDLLFGQVPMEPFGDASPFLSCPRGAGNFWAHPTARLSDVRVSGPAHFAEGARLGPGVRIGSAVSVGAFAQVGRGASLNRVVVLDGAEVPEGAVLEDCLWLPGGVRVPLEPPDS